MAWPPPVMAINRTNADPQQDTHPNDHNAINLAMNDTVLQIEAIKTEIITIENNRVQFFGFVPPVAMLGGGSPVATLWVAKTQAIVTPPWATSVLLSVSVTGHWGSTAGDSEYQLTAGMAGGPAGAGAVIFHVQSMNYRMPTVTVDASFPVTPGSLPTWEMWCAKIAGGGNLTADNKSLFTWRLNFRRD